MDWLTAANLDNLTGTAALVAIALAVITDKLVWHTRLAKSEARADRWEAAALAAMQAGAKAGVTAAEVAVGIVSSIPDPQGDRDKAAQARREGVIGP